MKPEKENVSMSLCVLFLDCEVLFFQVERELKEVEVLIRQSEPVVQQVATRINQLLQLC